MEVLGSRIRVVDLGRTVGPTPSEPDPPRLRYTSHEEGAKLWRHSSASSRALPSSRGLAGEKTELSTHAGTHMDVPWHYAPVSEGMAARKIDEMPPDLCVGPAVVLDVSQFELGGMG